MSSPRAFADYIFDNAHKYAWGSLVDISTATSVSIASSEIKHHLGMSTSIDSDFIAGIISTGCVQGVARLVKKYTHHDNIAHLWANRITSHQSRQANLIAATAGVAIWTLIKAKLDNARDSYVDKIT